MMNKLSGFFLFAIIITITFTIVIVSCWVLNTIETQNSVKITIYIVAVISAIIILIVAVLSLLMTLLDIREQSSTYKRRPTSPIKITLEIDDTPASLEAPDIDSASKLLEVMQTKKTCLKAEDIYDFPEIP